MSGRKSLAELVADLEDPAPKDIDPEALDTVHGNSDHEEELNEDAGRSHYENVSKSKLRKQAQASLGSQYSGSKVSRNDLKEAEDHKDNPFKRKSHSDLSIDDDSYNESYDDPDQVDLAVQDEDDEEIDSDDAFGAGEEEIFRNKGFTFKDSGKSLPVTRKTRRDLHESDEESNEQDGSVQGENDEPSIDAEFDDLQMNGQSSSEVDSDEDDDISSDQSMTDKSEADEKINADVLRPIMSSEEKNLVSGMSEAMQAEASKGTAIKKQYANFDILVGSRVQLQKSLIAANSIPLSQDSAEGHSVLAEAAEAAENAAIEAMNLVTSLLHGLRATMYGQEKAANVLGKRPFSATTTTASEEIEQALNASHQAFKPHRRTILTKWANKTQAATLSTRNRLVQKPSEDSLINTLDGHLLGTNQDHLVKKTRVARSCAPVQQAAEPHHNKKSAEKDAYEHLNGSQEDGSKSLPIFDDADFYALLLRELIDHKKSYSSSKSGLLSSSVLAEATTPTNLLRGNKTKGVNVDTKASKGRKMKYTVHEKLQNFMAPMDLGTWERRQAEELFAGLLGKHIARLDEREDVDMINDPEEDLEMHGLRLFEGR